MGSDMNKQRVMHILLKHLKLKRLYVCVEINL